MSTMQDVVEAFRPYSGVNVHEQVKCFLYWMSIEWGWPLIGVPEYRVVYQKQQVADKPPFPVHPYGRCDMVWLDGYLQPMLAAEVDGSVKSNSVAKLQTLGAKYSYIVSYYTSGKNQYKLNNTGINRLFVRPTSNLGTYMESKLKVSQLIREMSHPGVRTCL